MYLEKRRDEVETMKLAEKRLKEFKEDKTKPLGEKDFREFMKNEATAKN